MLMTNLRVVIFSLISEEINNRIDNVVYNNGFLEFYKNGVLFKSFNITSQTSVEETCETQIKTAYRILVNKIRRYGA